MAFGLFSSVEPLHFLGGGHKKWFCLCMQCNALSKKSLINTRHDTHTPKKNFAEIFVEIKIPNILEKWRTRSLNVT